MQPFCAHFSHPFWRRLFLAGFSLALAAALVGAAALEVAIVPGISGALHLLTTDVASNNVGVIEISASILP